MKGKRHLILFCGSFNTADSRLPVCHAGKEISALPQPVAALCLPIISIHCTIVQYSNVFLLIAHLRDLHIV